MFRMSSVLLPVALSQSSIASNFSSQRIAEYPGRQSIKGWGFKDGKHPPGKHARNYSEKDWKPSCLAVRSNTSSLSRVLSR